MSSASTSILTGAAALGAAFLLPAACLFPTYSFDLPAGGAGGGGTTTSSSSSGTTTSSATTTSSTSTTSTSSSTTHSTTTSMGGGGMGGMGTTTTTTTSSTTTSGDPCTTADCGNPNCQSTYSCVPATPAGWTGYFSLYDGPPATDPGCGGLDFPTSAFLGNNQLSAPQASCSVCTCAAPQGGTCQVPAVDVSDSACGQALHCYRELDPPPVGWVNGTCYGTDGAPAGDTGCGPLANMMCMGGGQPCNVSLRAGATTVTGGSCVASQQVPNTTPVAWAKAGEACSAAPSTGTGCNPGQSCLARPKAPFEAGVCIQKDGDNACPPGQFTQKHLFYQGANDTRSCSPCACGNPVGTTCNVSIDVFSSQFQNDCAATKLATLQAGGCANISGNPVVGSRKATTTPPTGGSCPPNGGLPTGSATPTQPTTFCCIP